VVTDSGLLLIVNRQRKSLATPSGSCPDDAIRSFWRSADACANCAKARDGRRKRSQNGPTLTVRTWLESRRDYAIHLRRHSRRLPVDLGLLYRRSLRLSPRPHRVPYTSAHCVFA